MTRAYKLPLYMGHCYLTSLFPIPTQSKHNESLTKCSSAHARLASMTAYMQFLRLHTYVLAHFQHIKAFIGCLSRGDHLHRERFPVHLSPPSPGATSSGQWCRFPWHVIRP